MNAAPLIVTAQPDPASFAVLDAMRRAYFPAKLNKIPAHFSLFHHLPAAEARAIHATLADECGRLAPFELQPRAVRSLGRGVALAYDCDGLARLHGRLARAWQAWLTPQDRQPFKAHVTIQNKVEPAEARTLLERLQAEPMPPCRIDRLVVWRYLGGPWELFSSHELSGGG